MMKEIKNGATFYDRINVLYEEARDHDHRIGRKKFAELCEVTRWQMNAWLSRNGQPNIQTLKHLARKCDVSVSWLVGETELRRIQEVDITKGLSTSVIQELNTILDYVKFKHEKK